MGMVESQCETASRNSDMSALADGGRRTAAAGGRGAANGEASHTGSSVATAMTASPRPLPIQPMRSFVFPLTITAPGSTPSAPASLARIRSRWRLSAGRSQITVTSAWVGRHPASATRRTASRSISMESRPALAGSVSGKSSPMSPTPAPPRIASVTAWATASASEWPTRVTSAGIFTPARSTPSPSAKRCESYPIPTRVVTAGGSRGGRGWVVQELVVLLPPARGEPRYADQPLHLADGRAESRVGRGDDVLLEHQRPEIVAPEMERRLPDFHSHRHPARLDVRDVVEHHARERRRAKVVHGVGLRLVAHRRRVLRLERPADERREPACAVLQVAQATQVLEALLERFADAVHHRARGLESLLMRDLHDFEPAVGAGLLARDLVAHALHEDLAAAAGNRVEPRRDELADDLARVHPVERAPEIHLARAESVHVDRVVPLDVAEQIEVPREGDVRIVTALHQDLHAAQGLHLVDLGADLLEAERPPFRVSRAPVECAEAAVGDAHVRVVDVAIHDVRDDVVRMRGAARPVGFGAELEQRGALEPVKEVTHRETTTASRRETGDGRPCACATRRRGRRGGRARPC